MTTFSDKLTAASNRPAGFDYMRFVLASAVIFSHTFVAAYGNPYVMKWWQGPERGALGLILPPFFALSGFLVAGSLERNKSLITFLGLRAIRLIPALAVETTLSALILGPLLTSLPLSEYFAASGFRHYFLNILGLVHFTLPGVFQNTPSPYVNAQLWTLPFELECYAALALLAIAGIASRRWLLLLALFGAQALVAYHLFRHGAAPPTLIKGRVLVCCFLAGVALFKFRDRVPHGLPLFLCSVAATVCLLEIRGGDQFLALPSAYMTAWLGLLNPRRNALLLSGDYSYGLFLYGYPIQQAVTTLGSWTRHWEVNMLLAYPATLALAVFSWWCIERPALGLKRYLVHCEKAALRFPPLRWHSERVFGRA